MIKSNFNGYHEQATNEFVLNKGQKTLTQNTR